jgi:hypothetical protein
MHTNKERKQKQKKNNLGIRWRTNRSKKRLMAVLEMKEVGCPGDLYILDAFLLFPDTLLFFSKEPNPMLSLVCLVFALILTSSLVSTSPIVRRAPTGVQTDCKKGYFALTYDDGPYEYTEELIDKLNAAGVKVSN